MILILKVSIHIIAFFIKNPKLSNFYILKITIQEREK